MMIILRIKSSPKIILRLILNNKGNVIWKEDRFFQNKYQRVHYFHKMINQIKEKVICVTHPNQVKCHKWKIS